jgi:hypothetical protein
MTMRHLRHAAGRRSRLLRRLERADLDAMMAIWAEDEEVICTHPGGERLAGFAAVRESWRQVFAGGRAPACAVPTRYTARASCWPCTACTSTIGGRARIGRPPPVVASNVYVRGAQGWHMLVAPRLPGAPAAKPAPTPATCIEHSRVSRAALAARRPRADHLAGAAQGPAAALPARTLGTPDGDFIDLDWLDGPPGAPCWCSSTASKAVRAATTPRAI